MSMIHCYGCGHQIHEAAMTCPSCGAPQNKQVIAVKTLPKNPTTMGQLLFSFEGRISRYTFWNYFLLMLIICGVSFVIDGTGILGGILTLYPSLANNVKRCHDVNRSGWFALILFIPILNIWPIIELGFIRGTRGDNQYGVDPLIKDTTL